MSICRVISCVVGRGYVLWPVRSLGKTLLPFALLHFVLQGQTCLLLQVSLDFLLLYSSTLWWKGHLILVLVLEGLIGHQSTIQLQLLWHQKTSHYSNWFFPNNFHGGFLFLGNIILNVLPTCKKMQVYLLYNDRILPTGLPIFEKLPRV